MQRQIPLPEEDIHADVVGQNFFLKRGVNLHSEKGKGVVFIPGVSTPNSGHMAARKSILVNDTYDANDGWEDEYILQHEKRDEETHECTGRHAVTTPMK